jgi:hypothetical protein
VAWEFAPEVTAMCLALAERKGEEDLELAGVLAERLCDDTRLESPGRGDSLRLACESAACLGAALRCRSSLASGSSLSPKQLCRVAAKVVLSATAAIAAAGGGGRSAAEDAQRTCGTQLVVTKLQTVANFVSLVSAGAPSN